MSESPGPEHESFSVCDACGTEIAPALLDCPVCSRLIHAEELKALAAEADRATAEGRLDDARNVWREVLLRLPLASRQATIIADKITRLSEQLDTE